MSNFEDVKRQVFLFESFAKNQISRRIRMDVAFIKELNEETELEGLSLLAASKADYMFEHLFLLYTAGSPIEPMRYQLEEIVAAYEAYTVKLREYELSDGNPDGSTYAPLSFDQIAGYERCMQLIGLCYLLHRRDLSPRITAMQDPNYADTDALYEDLLTYLPSQRYDVNNMYHKEAYEPLLKIMYADTDEEAIEALQHYVKSWYPAMKSCPWHGGHERIIDDDGDYFGYWAFEAGAVAYLTELDDSSIEHMIYPHDLVKFAREFVVPDDDISKQPTTVKKWRCEAGEVCPKTGDWWSPANKMEKRHFVQGAVMPHIAGNSWGATIWYMSEE